jgi:hypothetical protein
MLGCLQNSIARWPRRRLLRVVDRSCNHGYDVGVLDNIGINAGKLTRSSSLRFCRQNYFIATLIKIYVNHFALNYFALMPGGVQASACKRLRYQGAVKLKFDTPLVIAENYLLYSVVGLRRASLNGYITLKDVVQLAPPFSMQLVSVMIMFSL